jgi:hypothetical protein
MISNNRKCHEIMGLCWHRWVIENSLLTDLNPKSHFDNIKYGGFGYECACGYRLVNRVNWNIGREAKLSPVRCVNPSYDTNIADAWELVKFATRRGYTVTLIAYDDGGYYCEFALPTQEGFKKSYIEVDGVDCSVVIGVGSTESQAIVATFLEAMTP